MASTLISTSILPLHCCGSSVTTCFSLEQNTAAAWPSAARAPYTSMAKRGTLMRRAGIAGGRQSLTTIEGLSPDLSHPLQLAWLEEDVPQCGYCQSGQLMSAAVLLREKPQPTDEDIDQAMTGNICRCGTYPRIRRAIHRAAGMVAKAGAQ